MPCETHATSHGVPWPVGVGASGPAPRSDPFKWGLGLRDPLAWVGALWYLPRMFRFSSTVRLAQTDAAGVMFFARYLEFAHLAFEHFMESIRHPLEPDLFQAQMGYPIVHVQADYLRPVRMGEALSSEVEVERIGRSSFTLRHRLVRDEATVAVVRMVHATASVRTKAAVPMPAELAQALQPHLKAEGTP